MSGTVPCSIMDCAVSRDRTLTILAGGLGLGDAATHQRGNISSSVKNADFRLDRAEDGVKQGRIWDNKSLSQRMRRRKL